MRLAAAHTTVILRGWPKKNEVIPALCDSFGFARFEEDTMSWTEITRPQHGREDLRYASDLRDAEWRILSPLLNVPSYLGRPRKVDMREVVNAILYILRSGCQWRGL